MNLGISKINYVKGLSQCQTFTKCHLFYVLFRFSIIFTSYHKGWNFIIIVIIFFFLWFSGAYLIFEDFTKVNWQWSWKSLEIVRRSNWKQFWFPVEHQISLVINTNNIINLHVGKGKANLTSCEPRDKPGSQTTVFLFLFFNSICRNWRPYRITFIKLDYRIFSTMQDCSSECGGWLSPLPWTSFIWYHHND